MRPGLLFDASGVSALGGVRHAGFEPSEHPRSNDSSAEKWKSVSSYRSQLPLLKMGWPFGLERRLRYERYWTIARLSDGSASE